MLKKGIIIVVGSILIAFGVNFFVIPNHLLDGGIFGLGILAKYIYGVKPGLTIILLSLPLYILAYFYKKDFFYNGVHGLLVSSFFIDLFHPVTQWNPGADPIIGAMVGGVVIGTGLGIMLLNNIGTGGSDLLALILSNITSINAGIYIFAFDCLVLIIGSFVISEITILYSACMVIMIDLTTSTIIKMFT